MIATLESVAKVMAIQMSSPPLSRLGMPVISDAKMAWLLVDAADACLKDHNRAMTFVELGSGEARLAIERILFAVVSSKWALPVVIVDWLACWLSGYRGSPEEPQLRSLLTLVSAQARRRDGIEVVSPALADQRPGVAALR